MSVYCVHCVELNNATNARNAITQVTQLTMKVERFEDLECWKEARKLVKMVYDAINSSEKFGKDYRLRDQATAEELLGEKRYQSHE